MPKRKPFEELTIQDDFMFCKVMQNKRICKRVLQLVLKEEDIKIKNIKSQQTIENNSESKSVRLDVLVEDEKNNHIDIEMQMVNNDKIAMRMRLYQATIDVFILEKGMPYANMPNTIMGILKKPLLVFSRYPSSIFISYCNTITYKNTSQQNSEVNL